MNVLQHSLPLDDAEGASDGAVAANETAEVAWIESDRGRPLHVRRATQQAAVERVFGRAFQAIVPTDNEWRDVLHPDDRQHAITALESGRRSGRYDAVYRVVGPDGAARRVRDRILVLADRWQVRIIGLLADDHATIESVDDVPKEAARSPTADRPPVDPRDAIEPEAAEWLDAALDEAILFCDHAGRVVRTFGPTELMPDVPEALQGRRVTDLDTLPAAMRQAWLVALDRCLDTQRAQIAAYRLDRGDGPRAFEARMMPIRGAAVIAIRDVGERDRLRGTLAHLALHDPLTGLGNLRALRERLAAWIRPGGGALTALPFALLLIDVDRFKQTNDIYGRSVGDSLLRLVAQRLQRETRAALEGRPYDAHDAALPTGASRVENSGGDAPDAASLAASFAASDVTPTLPPGAPDVVVARLGGDQFAIACRSAAWAPAAALAGDPAKDAGAFADALAARLVTALGVPTRIAGLTLFVRSSIGVALHPDDAPDAATLLAQAEGAMNRAKQAGRNQSRRRGDDARGSAGHQPPTDAGTLRDALAAGQFLLVYQPKFELATSSTARTPDGARDAMRPGTMIAVEALVRWRVPGGPIRLPQDFLELAETSGMIRPLGEWVLHTALAEAAQFATQGGARVGVAVNVSLLQLHDRAFVDTVAQALRTHGFAAAELTLEIAETAFVDDVRLVADVVAELSALGVRLAIDHFGVGAGGLVAMKSLPIDEIKIDRSFIAGAAIDAFDATIVAGLVDMAHNLGKTVTAEGVERVDQIAALHRMRCDAVQGYFIGEPMTAAELVAVPSLWGVARTQTGTATRTPTRPPARDA